MQSKFADSGVQRSKFSKIELEQMCFTFFYVLAPDEKVVACYSQDCGSFTALTLLCSPRVLRDLHTPLPRARKTYETHLTGAEAPKKANTKIPSQIVGLEKNYCSQSGLRGLGVRISRSIF